MSKVLWATINSYRLSDVSVPKRSAGVIRDMGRILEFIQLEIVKQVEHAIDVLYRGEARAEALSTLKKLSDENAGLYKPLRNAIQAKSNKLNGRIVGKIEDGRQKKRKDLLKTPTSVSLH